VRALALGAGSVAITAGVAGWLTLVAGADAARAVAALGVVAVTAAASAVVLGRPEPLVAALVLLGAAYGLILEIDEPPLQGRSAVVGALLLALGELGYLSLDARTAVTDEAGTLARRIAWVMTEALLALSIGAIMLVVVDVFRTGGIVVDAVGAAAAGTAVGLLVLAARGARSGGT
jgi:hypothetical protein